MIRPKMCVFFAQEFVFLGEGTTQNKAAVSLQAPGLDVSRHFPGKYLVCK